MPAQRSSASAKKPKKETNLTAGISEPEKVDEFLRRTKHPLLAVARELRKTILGVDKRIGEGIYWNAPTFYFTGKMEPFDPKTYKRYIVGFNFFKQDCIRLIFLRGASVAEHGGLLEGDYADGRRLAVIKNLSEAREREKDLKRVIKALVKSIHD